VVDRDEAEWLVKHPPLLRRPTIWNPHRPGSGGPDDVESDAPRMKLYCVGVITDDAGLRLRRADGSITTIEPKGFDHLSTPNVHE
jgi:hypothetical protein